MQLHSALHPPGAQPAMIGHSEAFLRMQQRARRIGQSEHTALIVGPTGSGKELIAHTVHQSSSRHDLPMIAVNCGALPDGLIEDELFGHTRGAFTGAMERRAGLIASADQGTLFLDEVNALSPKAQVQLLRFLETGEYRSVGSDGAQQVNTRIIAATNQDLRKCVADGTFREDLMYRLDVLRIDVPSLADRDGDVHLLAEHFLHEIRPGARFSACALQTLRAYSWPGNVRELKHRIESCALLEDSEVIDARSLGLETTAAPAQPSHAPLDLEQQLWTLIEEEGFSLCEAVSLCERMLVRSALRAEQNNRTRAAQRLGIHVRTIFKKLSR